MPARWAAAHPGQRRRWYLTDFPARSLKVSSFLLSCSAVGESCRALARSQRHQLLTCRHVCGQRIVSSACSSPGKSVLGKPRHLSSKPGATARPCRCPSRTTTATAGSSCAATPSSSPTACPKVGGLGSSVNSGPAPLSCEQPLKQSGQPVRLGHEPPSCLQHLPVQPCLRILHSALRAQQAALRGRWPASTAPSQPSQPPAGPPAWRSHQPEGGVRPERHLRAHQPGPV